MELPEPVQAKLQHALLLTLAALLALILLSALVIGGFVMLLMALTSGLAPVVGEPGAYAIAGLSCILVLLLAFRGLTPKRKIEPGPQPQHDQPAGGDPTASGPDGAPLDTLRQAIRTHPWESVATSFALGLVQSGDPRLRELLMDSSLAYLKTAREAEGDAPGSAPASGAEAGSASETADGSNP